MGLLHSFFITVLASFALFLSCDGEEDRSPNCTTVLCPPNFALLDYQDAEGNPLINSMFVRDSFKLYNPTSTTYIKTLSAQDNRLLFRYDSLETGGTYFLELDTEEVDTLMFNYTIRPETCCTIYTLDSLRYNGSLIAMPQAETIVLVRD